MQVYIAYSADYKPCPGGVETLATPTETGYDQWRARFCRRDERTWGLLVSRLEATQGAKPAWTPKRWMIVAKAESQDAYASWLEGAVDLIEIDGRTFWKGDI